MALREEVKKGMREKSRARHRAFSKRHADQLELLADADIAVGRTLLSHLQALGV